MAAVLSRRLGKRSLLGARVAAPDAIAAPSQSPEFCPHEDAHPEFPHPEFPHPEFPTPGSPHPEFPHPGSPGPGSLGQPHGQQVLLAPVEEQIPGFPVRWRPQERAVSCSIDVPRRSPEAAAVAMDEMVAALVLTSLSCSPALPPSRVAGDPWRDAGDISDSGSSTTSGHWSSATASPPHRGDSATASPPHPSPPSRAGSATASPPRHGGSATASPPRHGGSATASPLTDDGFDTDPEPAPEPAPRRRKNSVMFKCLWPGCGKVLRSGVGIKRHVRSRHLGDGSEREEDFYYTELQVPEEPPLELPPAPVTSVPSVPSVTSVPSATSCSAPILIQPGPGQPGLSHSAPGSFWHIQADHAYQALPSIQIPVSPHIFTSISWAAATSTLPSLSPSLSPVRSRSLSLSEPRPPPLLKPQLLVASPPRLSLRKTRGEAKKCRKVYGIEHRDQWCTACRWKKACQRFLD